MCLREVVALAVPLSETDAGAATVLVMLPPSTLERGEAGTEVIDSVVGIEGA